MQCSGPGPVQPTPSSSVPRSPEHSAEHRWQVVPSAPASARDWMNEWDSDGVVDQVKERVRD